MWVCEHSFLLPETISGAFCKGYGLSYIYIYARALRVHAACTTHRLHMKKSHIKLRSACLNQLNALFHTITGRNLPIQKYIVDVTPASINSNVLALKIKKYTGLANTLIHDCEEIDGYGDCSWELPQGTHLKVLWSSDASGMSGDSEGAVTDGSGE